MTAHETGLEIQVAASLLAEGRAAEAARSLERVVNATPAYPAALVLLAKAYESEERPADALEAWNRAFFFVPSSPLIRRERLRLMESGVEAPPPIPPSSVDRPAAAGPPPPGARSVESETGFWAETDEAPDERTQSTEEMAPFEWLDDADPGRPPRSMPDEADEADAARLFAEVAFADEVATDPQPVHGSEERSEESDREGWTLLGEIDERLPDDADQPVEATVVPPAGFTGPSYWRVVPTQKGGSDRPTLEEEDLDSLIRQIEDAPRIKPDPHYVPPAGFEIEPSPREDEDVVSETLARIYAAQHQFGEAASVYEKLALQRPADAETFRQRAAEMREAAGRGDA